MWSREKIYRDITKGIKKNIDGVACDSLTRYVMISPCKNRNLNNLGINQY